MSYFGSMLKASLVRVLENRGGEWIEGKVISIISD